MHEEKIYNDKGWEQPWPIHPDVYDAVFSNDTPGNWIDWCICRSRYWHTWNDAYVRHIEEMYWDKDLEAIDVVGYNPIRKEHKKEK